MPSVCRLRELLTYDPETGVFRWNVRPGPFSNVKAGSMAGGLNSDGYIQISVDGTKHKAHRLAWLYMTGEWPEHQIDHRDRNRANNAWANLREATPAQNAQNRPAFKNKIGRPGVARNHRGYMARISINGERVYLGTFSTASDAEKAYRAAARDLHREFAGGVPCL